MFLTHGHGDHFGDTLHLACRLGAEVFCIHEIAVYLKAQGAARVTGLNKGGTVAGPAGVRATMVDARHSGGLDTDAGVLPGGEPAGWVLAFPGGPTLYHAGDTMLFGDMALIRELWAPDIAFLPIGGHYTMDPAQAARAARLLGVQDGGAHPLRHLPHPRRHARRTGRRPRRQRHRGGRPGARGAGRALSRRGPADSERPVEGVGHRGLAGPAALRPAEERLPAVAGSGSARPRPGPRPRRRHPARGRRPGPATAGWRAPSPGARWPGGSR